MIPSGLIGVDACMRRRFCRRPPHLCYHLEARVDPKTVGDWPGTIAAMVVVESSEQIVPVPLSLFPSPPRKAKKSQEKGVEVTQFLDGIASFNGSGANWAAELPMDPDVAQLILLARQDDPAAIDRLLAVYRNYLKVLAQIWLTPQFPARLDASDLVQETLLKAHQRFDQFHGESEGELTAWLRKILARHVVDVVRRSRAAAREPKREKSLENLIDDSAAALENLIGHSGSSPSEQAQRREHGVILADALSALSDLHREAIVLRSLKELPWNEVAAQMNRTISTVRMFWVRGLSELRTKLEDRL
jgi:RNA polymerase sigma-70 factor (ECF subfamily)